MHFGMVSALGRLPISQRFAIFGEGGFAITIEAGSSSTPALE
jgi:hypothetical protein